MKTNHFYVNVMNQCFGYAMDPSRPIPLEIKEDGDSGGGSE